MFIIDVICVDVVADVVMIKVTKDHAILFILWRPYFLIWSSAGQFSTCELICHFVGELNNLNFLDMSTNKDLVVIFWLFCLCIPITLRCIPLSVNTYNVTYTYCLCIPIGYLFVSYWLKSGCSIIHPFYSIYSKWILLVSRILRV